MKHPRLFDDASDGATITDLKPLPSDPNIRSVRVDGRVVAHLRASDVEQLGLFTGVEWTSRRARAVEHCVRLQQARKLAMRVLSRRAISRASLRARLESKGCAPDVADQALDELATDGWLDDERLAESIVHERTARRPAGEQLLMETLTARGIDESTARRVVERALDERDPVEDATAFALKRLRSMGDASGRAAARRIGNALMRRGFDEETARAALQRLDLDLEAEHDVDDCSA